MFTIACDFDGTIVKHEYPAIGEEIPGAIDTLKYMKEKHGCALILWTVRDVGHGVEEAVEWCRERGLEWDAVNENVEPIEGLAQHKVLAKVYIDDRGMGTIMRNGDSDLDEDTWSSIKLHLKKLVEGIFERALLMERAADRILSLDGENK